MSNNSPISITPPDHPYSMCKNAIMIVDTKVIAKALADTLSQSLSYPVFSIESNDFQVKPSCTLALIEILMPNDCGITKASNLQQNCDISVAVWSTKPSPLYSWVAWKVGLNGCLDKNMAWSEIIKAIELLNGGTAIWPPHIWDQILTFENQIGKRLRELSELDWERWLDLFCCFSLKELSFSWQLSLRGTSKAKDRLCEKLKVIDPRGAAKLAWSTGLAKMDTSPSWSEPALLYQTKRLNADFE